MKWHTGERAAQLRAFGDIANDGGIRPALTEQHKTFYAMLPFVVVGTLDERGWPVATILAGAPGFVSAPDPRTLVVRAPAPVGATPGAVIGVLGIQLETRRRNRANGRVVSAGPEGITIAVEQAFGNCPQYIHPRRGYAGPRAVRTGLDADGGTIAAADTFFVVSGDEKHGLDVSHRGGPPGFVHVDGHTLVVPDYPGNHYMNTFGNFLASPRAALLFPDFARGDALHLQGTVEILWDGPEVDALEGAERAWRVTVTPQAPGCRQP